MFSYIKIGLLGVVLMSCKHSATPADVSPGQAEEIPVAVEQSLGSFPFPAIPEVLTSPKDRKAYLLTHYWEQLDFADTTLVNNRDVTEQGFVNFIALLAEENTPEELIRESLKNWGTRFLSEAHARKVLTQMADDYWYNPNSPFYNERLYGLYLETLLSQLPQEDAMRFSYQFKLELLKRNQVGKLATDFRYELSDGTRRSLMATPVKGNRLLLLFYDPECESCHEVLLQMATDKALAAAVKTEQISVLAIYTEGNEDAWRKNLPDMPAGWMVGMDREVVKNEALYDLKAMPSLYLLDGKKQVLLKDAPYGVIRQALSLKE